MCEAQLETWVVAIAGRITQFTLHTRSQPKSQPKFKHQIQIEFIGSKSRVRNYTILNGTVNGQHQRHTDGKEALKRTPTMVKTGIHSNCTLAIDDKHRRRLSGIRSYTKCILCPVCPSGVQCVQHAYCDQSRRTLTRSDKYLHRQQHGARLSDALRLITIAPSW